MQLQKIKNYFKRTAVNLCCHFVYFYKLFILTLCFNQDYLMLANLNARRQQTYDDKIV